MARMRKKLLHKTLRVYILFSVLILVISAPVFYFLTESLYIDDANEALILRKNEFVKYSIPEMKTADIAVWNKVNRDIKIEVPTIKLLKDSIFYKFYLDTLANENEPYRVLLTPIVIENKPYHFKARINLVESEDLIKNIALLFFIILSLLLTGLYFITKRLSTKLWEPFYAILHQIEQFEIDKNTQPKIIETSIEEFYRLNTSINHLIERNTLIYQSQQEFIENAAHELQTPLAVFQAKLEMLMQHPDLTPNQAEILVKLSDSSARLNRLNKNLLLLSKIDNSQFIAKENVSINDIIEKQLEFFTEQAEEKNITIKLETKADIKIESNPVLMEILVSNLLLNSIRHNEQDGSVSIILNQNSLVVSNTGNKQAIPTEKLFQRFSKTNPSVKGSGLGLAIVKKITDLNKWSVDYAFQDNFHRFTVKF
jgi:signal transduction histidine kinase